MAYTPRVIRLSLDFSHFNNYSEETLEVYGKMRDCVVLPTYHNSIFTGKRSKCAYFNIRPVKMKINRVLFYVCQTFSKKKWAELKKKDINAQLVGNIYEADDNWKREDSLTDIPEAYSNILTIELDFNKFNCLMEGKRMINGKKMNVIIIPCDLNGMFKSHDEQQGYRASYTIRKSKTNSFSSLYFILQIATGKNRESLENEGMKTQIVGNIYLSGKRYVKQKQKVDIDYFDNIFK